MKIKDIKAREILDSRGNPTVEVDIILENGVIGRASVPSGASTGKYEAVELRDGDERFGGKGVLKAVLNVEKIIKPYLLGLEVSNQKEIDEVLLKLDNTPNKSNLGANAILGVSLAAVKAASNALNMPVFRYLGGLDFGIPYPLMNLINGGEHSSANIDFQEYMIIPVNTDTFKESMDKAYRVFNSLKDLLKERNMETTVGDEGGFAPSCNNNEEPLKLLSEAVRRSGYKLGEDILFALDVAASEFYDEISDKYVFSKSTQREYTASELITYYKYLVDKYPIISIEDGLAEEDWEGWQELTERLGRIQLVGDDLFVTNKERLMKGINLGVANAILIKPNQIGTVTEMIETIQLANRYGYSSIISHRSGETEDATIADIAVAFNTGQIKAGSISRTDRTMKYNQLIRIEELLKKVK